MTTDLHWEWYETRKIRVYGLSGVSNNEKDKVIEIITEVINEFVLPFSIKKGDINKNDDIEQLLQQCSNNAEIDFNKLEDELNRKRREVSFLPFGVVIIVNDAHSFKEFSHDMDPAFYACASYEGLMVIKSKYIDKATKHEFGHMIGLDHHENCIMEYSCNHNEFCENCRSEIKNHWKSKKY